MSRRLMTKNEWSGFKRRLTIAKKSGPEAVIKVCDEFFALEGEVVLPDDWHRFNIAREDAVFDLSRRRVRW